MGSFSGDVQHHGSGRVHGRRAVGGAVPQSRGASPLVSCEGGAGDQCRLHSTQDERAERPFPVAISLAFRNSRTIVVAAANYMDAEAPLFLGGDEIAVVWETPVVSTLLPEIAPDILAVP